MNVPIGIYTEINRSVYSPQAIPLSFNEQLILRFGVVGFILYWVLLCIVLIIVLNVGARAIEKASGINIIEVIITARKSIK